MIDLVGHIINKIEFNEEEGTLSLTVDGDKIFLIQVESECCSSGELIGIQKPLECELPQKVVSSKESSVGFSTDDYYTVYEETLELENGKNIHIVYDNRSNGYYGSTLKAYYNGESVYEFPEKDVKK